MSTLAAPATPALATGGLSDAERSACAALLQRDGYFILPQRLPPALLADALTAIDRVADTRREGNRLSVKASNAVELEPAFMQLATWTPMLQLAYDAFGPMFHLNQSNCVWRAQEAPEIKRDDFITSVPWHADGPRPGMFPQVNGTMGLHYLKFGVFLTDTTHAGSGALEIVRGSHVRPELDGKTGGKFAIGDYAADLVRVTVPAGTVLAFHQAQWHAAAPNLSSIVRKNLYISYCPSWMRPFDREMPAQGALDQVADPVARWLLGEWRPATRWWLPSQEDMLRLAAYRKQGEHAVIMSGAYKD